LLTTSITFTDTSRLASEATQVIELGPSDATALYQVDVIDDGGV
jgi:hypothetical protein